MEEPNKPGLPEIHDIDASVFERINNSLMDLKRNFHEQALIEQMIQMSKILQSLFNQIKTAYVSNVGQDISDSSTILTMHGNHLKSHDQHLETHDRHLQTHDGHLQTHGEYLELLNTRLNSLSS